jgi:hypothetical protein
MLQRGDRICQEKEHNRDNTLALNYVAVSGDFNLSRCRQLLIKPYLAEFRMGRI